MRREDLDSDAATRARMRQVRTENTEPERMVRSVLHRMGYRFSLHRQDLPGNPDIVMPKYQTVVFVHGCFWHGHANCRKGRSLPQRNRAFWKEKIQYNREKDRRVTHELRQLGWRVVVVWECETREQENLARKLENELSSTEDAHAEQS